MNSRSLARAFSALAMIAVLADPRPAAHAQGAPPPSDSVKAIARERYNAGVAAYDAGRYEDARTSFLQAYALTHHPAVLLNLGQSELRSKHEDDAANHLQQFLREHTAATPENRAAAEKGLAEAKQKVGWVVISVDSVGADLSIDGNTFGKSPLVDPVYLKPGKHTVFAALQGKTAASSVEVKLGQAASTSLSLGVVTPLPAPPTPPQPETPPPTPPTLPPTQPTPPPEMPPTNPVPPPGPGTGPVPGPGPGPGTEPLGPPRYTFGEWYKHKPLAWVGTGLAAVGLGMAIGGGAAAMNASSTSNADVAATQQHITLWNMGADPSQHGVKPTGANVAPSNVCNPSVLGNSAALQSYFGSACSTVQGDINSYHTDVAVMATGWVFFGLGVVGTVAYVMVDWYPRRATTSTGSTAPTMPQVAVLPVVSPTMKGLGIVGQF